MENTFFQDLSNLLTDGCLKIVIKKGDDNQLTVSVLPTNDNVGDNAKNNIVPLVLKGTAEELDNGFIKAIQEPIAQTNTLLLNMETYLKQKEQAATQSKMVADKAKQEKEEKDQRKKKFDALVKKVEELDTEKKFKEAIEMLFKASDLVEHTDEIKKRISELQAKSQPTIFNL